MGPMDSGSGVLMGDEGWLEIMTEDVSFEAWMLFGCLIPESK